MKIGLYFNVYKNMGGAYQYSLLLLEAFSRIQNHTCTIFNTTQDIPEKYYAVPHFQINDISSTFQKNPSVLHAHIGAVVNVLVTFMIRLHMGGIIVFLYKHMRHSLLESIHRSGVDVVVFPLTTMETFGCKVPYILAIHDLQHKVNPQFVELTGFGQSEIRDLRYKDQVKHAFRLLSQSQCGKDDITKYYECDPKKIRIVPYIPPVNNGDVLTKNISSVRLKLPERYIFYPANYWSHKNHIHLIESVKLLVARGEKIHVVLTGTKSVEYSVEKKLQERINELGLEKYVHHIGYISPSELIYVYTHALALVMPTYIGPVNLPVYEAWSFGIPVIASKIRDYEEIAKDAALLVNPDSPEEIADAIMSVIHNTRLKKKLILNGKHILKKRTMELFTNQVRSLIRECEKEL